jgi:hypothetical protein
MHSQKALLGIALFGALAALATLSADHGFAQTPFFQEKTSFSGRLLFG